MHRRSFLAGLLAAVVAAAGVSADARMHHPARGHRILAAGGALPLDGLSAPSGAYSFRKLKSTYAGNAIKLRRATGGTQDIAFLGCTGFTGCPWDEASATAFCAATTCFADTWYDQSGNVRDLVQATTANQPQLIFSCNGTLPCIRTTNTTQSLATVATVTPATGVASLSAVASRTVGTGFCSFANQTNGAGNRLGANSVASQWLLGGASGTVTATATDGVWHAANGVVAGASSVIGVDGVETTGTVTGSTAAAVSNLFGAAATASNFGEKIVWDNYQLTAGERAVLVANQRGYWGTP